MICPQCTTAGQLNANLNAGIVSENSAHPRKALKQRIKKWHSKCSYGVTCPCQHVVGEVLKGATG